MKKLQKRNIKYVLIISISILLLVGIIIYSYPYIRYLFKTTVDTTLLDSLELDNIDKLMIVAHPDDETLWGGNALLNDDYFVVCLTNGYNSTRKEEFLTVLKKTGDKGIILDYPDKIHNNRSDWSFCENDMKEDIATILSYKAWNLVVTHNENGEYGHNHHIMTHSYVNEVCNNLNITASQYYFGNYYTRASLLEMKPDELPTVLSTEDYLKKFDLVTTYTSQCKTLVKLGHMIAFEEFIPKE